MKRHKIGRNDPCPCGSGKKFKKCCIDKNLRSETNNNNDKYSAFISELRNYYQTQLLSILGGLQVYPDNIHCTNRLEFISQIICSYSSQSTRLVDSKVIEDLLNHYFPSDSAVGTLED